MFLGILKPSYLFQTYSNVHIIYLKQDCTSTTTCKIKQSLVMFIIICSKWSQPQRSDGIDVYDYDHVYYSMFKITSLNEWYSHIVISGIYKCKFVIMDVVIKLLGFWNFESIVAKRIKIIIKEKN
jgi:hypothetical protein